MASEERIILDLSDDVQTLLEQQQVNLYEELQRELPALRTEMKPDPNAPTSSRGDPITIILAVSTLVSSLTPLIIHLLNQFTPPNRTVRWQVDEQQSRQADGPPTTHRLFVYSSDEQRPWASLPYPSSQPSAPPGPTSVSEQAKDSQQ
jgi:hypothetical protein